MGSHRLPSRLQQPTTMFRIVFIASFCLLLNQVSANTCCVGKDDDSCSKTCETSSSPYCVKADVMAVTGAKEEATLSICEDQLETQSSGNCKKIDSLKDVLKGDACVTENYNQGNLEVELKACADGCGAFKFKQGNDVVEMNICCCRGDKCNGGNFQHGSVFMTIILGVVSRFI